ncbi:MAG: CvpA family protein [Candidatus Zipacnadales bacterium]
MTWLDLITIVLFVAGGLVEAKRGSVPAVIDLIIVLFGITLAKTFAPSLTNIVGSHGTAFIILLVGVVIIAGVGSSLIDAYTKWDIGPYDPAVAGVLGAVGGLVVAHGAYYAAATGGGALGELVQRSLLAPEIYDLRTLHAIGDMLRNLGGGPTIVDEVRESQK